MINFAIKLKNAVQTIEILNTIEKRVFEFLKNNLIATEYSKDLPQHFINDNHCFCSTNIFHYKTKSDYCLKMFVGFSQADNPTVEEDLSIPKFTFIRDKDVSLDEINDIFASDSVFIFIEMYKNKEFIMDLKDFLIGEIQNITMDFVVS